VRLSKGQLRARIKGRLRLTFSEERISAHGGLELFRRYLSGLGLRRRLEQAIDVPSDYGAARILLALMGMLIVGGVRVTHLAFLGVDPVLLRFCGLKRLPSDRTVVDLLKRITPQTLFALSDLIRDLVYDQIERSKLARLTIDLDGTVLRTGAKVDGAARGFNPHHPKDPSYYPLTAHVAQTGQILRVWNRPGNVNDSHNAPGFLRVVLRELRERFGSRMPLELRMDGAFFLPTVLRFLDTERVEWSMKVPLWQWLGVREEISRRQRWTRVDGRIDGFETWLILRPWERVQRVVVYRKRVFHRTHKNFQLDLFSPDDGTFEYSAIATNKTLSVHALWHFMAGRGAHEKTLAELKQHYGFAAIPTNDRGANAVWQQLCVLTLNLVRSFQIALGAPRRARTLKRTYDYVFSSLQTLRFELIHQPARLVRPAGRAELRFAVSTRARERIRQVERRLQRAA
jgi:Transposase DDE domain group 1